MTWRQFRESTWQQLVVILLLIVLGAGVFLSYSPKARVWAMSLKFNFDYWPKTQVVEELIEIHHPEIIRVLMQNINDRERLPEKILDQYPEFDGLTFGEFCAWKIDLISPREFSLGDNRYTKADNIQQYKVWLENNLTHLAWDPIESIFKDKREEEE